MRVSSAVKSMGIIFASERKSALTAEKDFFLRGNTPFAKKSTFYLFKRDEIAASSASSASPRNFTAANLLLP
jgi:hypothetical protein